MVSSKLTKAFKDTEYVLSYFFTKVRKSFFIRRERDIKGEWLLNDFKLCLFLHVYQKKVFNDAHKSIFLAQHRGLTQLD